MPLSELAIKALKPKEKLYRITDSGGLILEVSPAGSKLWRWRYYYNGKPQMLALGRYPDTSLAEARLKRDQARKQQQAGKHPTREKKAEKLRRITEGENTFERVARQWLAIKEKGLAEKYRKQCLIRLEKHVFPLIGALPITEITIPDVVRVLEKTGQGGTIETAKRIKQLTSQIFRYGAQRGICLHNPAADLRDILPTVKEKHHACIHPNELPDLMKAIQAYGIENNNLTGAAMKFLALTFVRTGELIGARWVEIDWENQEWHIPAERMKMKRPHIVPLSVQALSLLKSLQQLTGHRDHVFHSGASKSKHISNGAILMALRRMNYQNQMTGHGFRTLASTILNEKGYQPDVIERQLAHEDSDKVRAAYNRAEYLAERKKMMQDYADLLDKATKEKSLKKIVGYN
ncbi:tyrosine-type recombinase/integrase [Spirosoma foliorum]|uniref:Tyrosine-type recombinase/integrase n=1 Tax=Spirosoma foliorum TaxID=2710596 RepID=A0A7G5GS61_9BACT|nr:tyrosine-type recombinase/integrase [Spirosoma foliorum]QMW01703.1 tyrosine-type recombinase/integrase [Spirosoma foliorum]